MKETGLAKYAFLALLALFTYLSYIVLEPFLSYLIFSVVLVVVFHRFYAWLTSKWNHPRTVSFLLVIAVLLLLVLPSIYIGFTLVKQAPAAYESFVGGFDAQAVEQFVHRVSGQEINTADWLYRTTQELRSFALTNAGNFLTSATDIVIGLFIMFFTMFFLFTQGDMLLERLKKIAPVSKRHQKALLKEVHDVIHATIVGQLILGAIQGIIGGVTFAILGIPNALFWGFVMVLFSVIPFLGSFVVWVPAAIWLFLTGHIVAAIVLAIIGFFIIGQIDNFLRPYIVGMQADIHPALVLVGVLGGLKVFGVIGFVTGPLILALFVTLLKFYKEDVGV